MAHQGKGPLRISIENFLETFGWWDKIKNWIYARIEGTEKAIIDTYQEPLTDLDKVLKDEIPLAKTLKDIFKGKHQGGVSSLLGFGAQMGMSAASGIMSPVMRYLNYWMDRAMRTARLDPSAGVPIARRMPEYEDKIRADLTDLGWDDELIEAWFTILQPILSAGELLQYWLRHGKDDTLIDSELIKQGWSPKRIEQIKELTEIIPGVNDLISMAVREAFTPATVERFKYAEDFPSEVLEPAAKQGLSEDWVKRYWYAHWVLPGLTQAFEMFHRLRPDRTDAPFEIDDLRLLLRTADIAPYFRDRLVEIAFTPLTRVDVRRMFNKGILTVDGVLDAYLDLGYNQRDAELMTDWTVIEETTEQRDLTRGVIMSGYKRGTLGQAEVLQSLVNIGHSQADAELIVAIADAEQAQKRLDAELDRIEFLFVEGSIEQEAVYQQLGTLNLPAEQMTMLISEWMVKRLKKISLPSKAEVFDLYERDILTLAEVQELLKRRGYDASSIAWYVELLDQQISEKASKELERTQKEQERIEKAEYATQYQRLKAAMDVEIAAIRLEMADLKLAMNYMLTDEEKTQAAETVMILKRDIADWNLAKAEIKYQAITPGETET